MARGGVPTNPRRFGPFPYDLWGLNAFLKTTRGGALFLSAMPQVAIRFKQLAPQYALALSNNLLVHNSGGFSSHLRPGTLQSFILGHVKYVSLICPPYE